MSLSSEFEAHAIEASHDFRLLMNAMARPGSIQAVDGAREPVAGLNNGSVLAALTLCDHETSVFVQTGPHAENVKEFLSFRCGCILTDDLAQADFVFLNAMPDAELLARLKIGNSQYPDRSATAIIEVKSLSEAGNLVLSGPGIKTTHSMKIDPISSDLITWWEKNNERFPLGIDLILTCDDGIAGLPRTVKIKER